MGVITLSGLSLLFIGLSEQPCDNHSLMANKILCAVDVDLNDMIALRMSA